MGVGDKRQLELTWFDDSCEFWLLHILLAISFKETYLSLDLPEAGYTSGSSDLNFQSLDKNPILEGAANSSSEIRVHKDYIWPTELTSRLINLYQISIVISLFLLNQE